MTNNDELIDAVAINDMTKYAILYIDKRGNKNIKIVNIEEVEGDIGIFVRNLFKYDKRIVYITVYTCDDLNKPKYWHSNWSRNNI